MLQVGPMLAVNFSAYETLRVRYMASHPEAGRGPPTYINNLNGAAAGFISTLVTYPLDTVRRRIQMIDTSTVPTNASPPPPRHPSATVTSSSSSSSSSPWGVLNGLVRREGLKGLYRGFGAECLKVIPGTAIGWGVYEIAKDVLGVGDRAQQR